MVMCMLYTTLYFKKWAKKLTLKKKEKTLQFTKFLQKYYYM